MKSVTMNEQEARQRRCGMKSKVATKILQLAAIIRNGALIGADEADSEKWARDLELAAKACEALRRHRENGSVTLRALAEVLGLSPSDLSAITYDGRADGKAPDFVRLPATEFRLIEPEEKKGGAE